MSDAAALIEAKHQLIYDLQLRLEKDLPSLAAHWQAEEYQAFQHDYCRFDSEIERVKQGLDMVHASLTGQALAPAPQPRPSSRPGPPRPRPVEGAQRLAAANAELNALLGALRHELEDSVYEWNEASRTAWDAAQRSWAEANSIHHRIVGRPPEPLPNSR